MSELLFSVEGSEKNTINKSKSIVILRLIVSVVLKVLLFQPNNTFFILKNEKKNCI